MSQNLPQYHGGLQKNRSKPIKLCCSMVPFWIQQEEERKDALLCHNSKIVPDCLFAENLRYVSNSIDWEHMSVAEVRYLILQEISPNSRLVIEAGYPEKAGLIIEEERGLKYKK